MVVGTNERALNLARLLEGSEKYGVKLTGFLTEDSTGTPGSLTLKKEYPVNPLEQLRTILHGQVVDEIVFAVDSQRLADLEEVFLLCDEEGVRTRVAVDFFPHVNSRSISIAWARRRYSPSRRRPHDEIRLLVKRAHRHCAGGGRR